jgi:hypothetical protein
VSAFENPLDILSCCAVVEDLNKWSVCGVTLSCRVCVERVSCGETESAVRSELDVKETLPTREIANKEAIALTGQQIVQEELTEMI